MLKWREDLRRITHFFYRTIDQFEIRNAHAIAGYLQRGHDHFLDQLGGFAGVPIANQLAHTGIERRIDAPLSPRWLIVNCAPGEIFFHDENVSAAAPTAHLRILATPLRSPRPPPAWQERLQSGRNQVLQNVAHVTDGQRIMTGVINEPRFAVGQSLCDFFRK